MKKPICLVFLVAAFSAMADVDMFLERTEISRMKTGWGNVNAGKSVGGSELSIGGRKFAHGVGTHAPSTYRLPVGGNALSFKATVGLDDETNGKGSVVFRVLADGKCVAEVAPKPGETDEIVADLAGANFVTLEVADAGDGNYDDHADWCDAVFTFKDGTGPIPFSSLTRQLGILTPGAAKTPRINAPGRYGARPGHPILFKLPVTGEAPIRLSAKNASCKCANPGKCKCALGLSFDPGTGILSGSIDAPGEHPVIFTAENKYGKTEKTVVFVIGDKLCLTPPMGYNSWNAFAGGVSDGKMRLAADKMIELGLDRHGYSYCNIDDFWQRNPENGKTDPTLAGPERNPDGTICVNARFPDMKALAGYIHSKGLKAGLYSSPGPYTCGGCTGSWMHELQDAKTYAEWGYDYLKYDWCSYGNVATGEGREYHTRPYFLMGRFLAMQPRDIVFSLCQYGNENVPAWGEQAGGQLWRTTGDIFDTWSSIYAGIRAQAKHWFYSRPGAWNDADMLVLGRTVWSEGRLTPNECYTHMSMWCMLASPLMIGCDLSLIDDFTLSLLTNDEVIAIDQDELGAAAALVIDGAADGYEVWARPLADGSMAFALINIDDEEKVVSFAFGDLGMRGTWKVRDLWRQKDEGAFSGSYGASIPGHATHLVKFSPGEGARLKPCLKDIRDNAWRTSFDADRAKAGKRASPAGGCGGCE